MQKIFITGGSGLLALNWAISQRNSSNVTLCFHERIVSMSGVNTTICALDSVNVIRKNLRDIKPNFVIHTAGLTNVEKCEEAPELAEYVNVTIAENVAIACAKEGIRLVHISTDHLFDGEKSLLTEDAIFSPLNVYGATKAKAEEKVYAQNEKTLIIRTNFYGWGTSYRYSFSDYVIASLRKKQTIKLFEDVFYTPIIVDNLIQTINKLLDKEAVGVFNVVGDERISKFQFGEKIAEKFGLDNTLNKRSQIKKTKHLVARPSDMSLSNRKVVNYLNCKVGSVEEHAAILLKQEENGIAGEIKKL